MNTSLQNIITHQSTSLCQTQVSRLFQKKQYPQFEIGQFQNNQQLIKKEEFVYLLKILQKWNKEVKSNGQSLNDSAYTKNDFIYSSLKRLAVQNSQVDSSLKKLYNWYTLTQNKNQQCYIKKDIENRSQFQEWQIRNSYKSNLPLQINNYRRRFILGQNQTCDNSAIRTVEQSPSQSRDNMSGSYVRKQDNYLQKYRESGQFKQEIKTYRKNKAYFYKNIPKNYYKNQFKRDKFSISASAFRQKDQFFPMEQIKSYRIKTTNGARPFESTTPSSLPKTLYSTFHKSNINKEQQSSLRENQDYNARYGLTNINGLGLMSNPFETKLRKKKK